MDEEFDLNEVMNVSSLFSSMRSRQHCSNLATQCWGLQTGPMHIPKKINTLREGNNKNSLELNAN